MKKFLATAVVLLAGCGPDSHTPTNSNYAKTQTVGAYTFQHVGDLDDGTGWCREVWKITDANGNVRLAIRGYGVGEPQMVRRGKTSVPEER